MNISEAIKNRKSVRGFLEKEVDLATVEKILDVARYSPSGANSQPWQVAVVSGEKKREVTDAILSAYRAGNKEERDYAYYPAKWKEPYKGRRIACGMQLYDTLGIDRKDKKGRAVQWEANYRGFDAPVLLFFFLDSSLAIGSYIDYGMFLQSVMLAALDEGLATCPQAALGGYAGVVKKELGYPGDTILLCGMALGYEDPGAVINSYRTPREEVAGFMRVFR